MLPSAIIVGGLIAYPFDREVYIGFTRTLGQHIGPFVGLANYRALRADRFFASRWPSPPATPGGR